MVGSRLEGRVGGIELFVGSRAVSSCHCDGERFWRFEWLTHSGDGGTGGRSVMLSGEVVEEPLGCRVMGC